MRTSRPLPPTLGAEFGVAEAISAGVSRKRLRSADLSRPFRGVRSTGRGAAADAPDPYEQQRQSRVARAGEYLPRLHDGHFFSHDTAVSIYGGPLPLVFTRAGTIADHEDLELHVSVLGTGPLPRVRGVTRHRAQPTMTTVGTWNGMPVSSPASAWASLGALPLRNLVALGDYFCRTWRAGVGRPTVGRAPLTTVAKLRTAITSGRRIGAANLRAAVALVREDSWSPRESDVRCELVWAGIPEPELNVDVFDAFGRFLGCVDMLYREKKVAIEYLGMLHGASWARDVERLARLRAAGYIVIEVTAPLLADPAELARRVRLALDR